MSSRVALSIMAAASGTNVSNVSDDCTTSFVVHCTSFGGLMSAEPQERATSVVPRRSEESAHV